MSTSHISIARMCKQAPELFCASKSFFKILKKHAQSTPISLYPLAAPQLVGKSRISQ